MVQAATHVLLQLLGGVIGPRRQQVVVEAQPVRLDLVLVDPQQLGPDPLAQTPRLEAARLIRQLLQPLKGQIRLLELGGQPLFRFRRFRSLSLRRGRHLGRCAQHLVAVAGCLCGCRRSGALAAAAVRLVRLVMSGRAGLRARIRLRLVARIHTTLAPPAAAPRGHRGTFCGAAKFHCRRCYENSCGVDLLSRIGANIPLSKRNMEETCTGWKGAETRQRAGLAQITILLYRII
eukprot:scaffold3504_cov240-Pinguiococcus_pyrenoidosus.AAC.6